MKVFTCKDHDGRYPVGTASVIVAESEDEARSLLNQQLSIIGLEGNGEFTLIELNTSEKQAVVLNDGDY